MNKIQRILVIAASSPHAKYGRHEMITTELCRRFTDICQTKDFTIDLLDLYNYSHPQYNESKQDVKDSYVIESQVRINQADLIAIFHPILWALPPAPLKAFVDKVFEPGFAYTYKKGMFYGKLNSKSLLVFAVSDIPAWQQQLIYNNINSVYWKRIVGDKTGMDSKIHMFGSARSVSESTIESWLNKVEKIALSINIQTSIIDLF